MDDLDSFTCSMYRQTEKVSKVNDMRLIRINELFTKQNRLVPSRNVDIGNLPPCRRSLSTTHPESKQSKCHRRNWRMIIIMSLVSYSGRMQLRSADSVTCSVPRTRTLLGDADRSFAVADPRVWKSLPAPIRTADRLSTFKRQLKTHLFNWDRGAYYWLVVLGAGYKYSY